MGDDEREPDDESACEDSAGDVSLVEDPLAQVAWREGVEQAVAGEQQNETDDRKENGDEGVVDRVFDQIG